MLNTKSFQSRNQKGTTAARHRRTESLMRLRRMGKSMNSAAVAVRNQVQAAWPTFPMDHDDRQVRRLEPIHLHLATISRRTLTPMIDGVTARSEQTTPVVFGCTRTSGRASRTARHWMPPSGQLSSSSPSSGRFIVQSLRQYSTLHCSWW